MTSEEIVAILDRARNTLDIYANDVRDATEKIKFLSNEVEVLKKALVPFAKFSLDAGKHWKDEDSAHFWFGEGEDKNIKMKDCREAARVLGMDLEPEKAPTEPSETPSKTEKAELSSEREAEILKYAKEMNLKLSGWRQLHITPVLLDLVEDYQRLKANQARLRRERELYEKFLQAVKDFFGENHGGENA